jgi:16S rRNA C967 or C1407 C5-methylase (RsmB/RsmF family)
MTVNEVVNSLVTKKKKKKRKRCVGNNPLSDARKAAKGITANSKADTLWHLKCGAGYFLFLSYYAKQPSGVVAHVVADEDTSNNMICCSKERTRVGQSRAAQRRKKKKIKIDNSSTSQNGVPSSSLTTDTSVTCGVSPIIDISSLPCEDSLLLQTFHRMGKSISHLNSFVNALSQPLPLTFRLRNLDPTHEKKLQLQKKLVNELSSNYGHLVKPVIFDSSIYQSFFPAVCHKRKVESSLHKLLMEASSSGILARQEIGSMLPVGVLHAGGWISKNSTLLDMCASPGSKTLQAYEVTKHVVANDVHPTRMEALRCAVDRSGLSCKGLTYTQMDASTFPIPKKKFDVVIADVPCSGDGTVRKDPRTLSTWNPHIAVVLHELQVRILEQALRIVRVGGVVSYSTCSFNPIENEAVVAAVLRRFSSQQTITEVELLEWPRNAFPGLKRRSGVNSWLVADCTNSEKDMDDGTDTEDLNPVTLRWHKNYRDALTAGMDNVVKSLWPPTEDENLFFFLNRCIRLWPQDQDSGGFFVALLRKNCELD